MPLQRQTVPIGFQSSRSAARPCRLREQVQLQQREISALTHRLEERQSREGAATPVATVTTGTCTPRRHPGTPASLCEGEDTDASWRYQDQVVLVQASDSDDILLLLNERGLPENVYLRSTWEKQTLEPPAPTAAEVDADADDSSSSPLSSMHRKATVVENVVDADNGNGAPQEPLVAIGRFQCWSSDSDIWSEPDRSVSEQRMGGVCRKDWAKQPRRSPKGARKASAALRQDAGSDSVGRKSVKELWLSGECGRSQPCLADGGSSASEHWLELGMLLGRWMLAMRLFPLFCFSWCCCLLARHHIFGWQSIWMAVL